MSFGTLAPITLILRKRTVTVEGFDNIFSNFRNNFISHDTLLAYLCLSKTTDMIDSHEGVKKVLTLGIFSTLVGYGRVGESESVGYGSHSVLRILSARTFLVHERAEKKQMTSEYPE